MDQQDWIALDCPTCGGRLRAPRSAVGTSVGCPTCHSAVKVRTATTTYSPPQMIVDSRRKLGATPQTATPDTEGFKSRVRSASDDIYKVDPDNPVMKRRDNRKARHGTSLTTWDNNGNKSSRSVTQSAGRRQRRIVLGLSLVTCGLFITVVGLVVSGKGSISLTPPAPVASTSTGHSALHEAMPLEMQSAADFRGKVWKVVSEFCNAPTYRELMGVIRDPERVGPIIRDYYTTGGNNWVPISAGEAPDPTAFETDKNWTAFKLPLPDFRSRSMAVEETPKGFKVDWESFVAYSEMPWDKLRETKPKSPVLIRAIVRRSNYFNFDFPSEDSHRCFQIYDEARDNVIYGYIQRSTEVDKKIDEIMLGAIDVHAILRVAYPQKSTANNQVNITEVVAKGWILGKDAPSSLSGSSTPAPASAETAPEVSGKPDKSASGHAPAQAAAPLLPDAPPPLPAAAAGSVGHSAGTSLLNDPDDSAISSGSNTSLGTTPGSGPPAPAESSGRSRNPLPSIR